MGDEFNKFGSWEDAWQQAFDDAEHTPPKKVWQGLENSLMEQQLKSYRRKLFLYQWLAAASVMLLGLWAGWWIMFGQPQVNQLADQQEQIQTDLHQTDLQQNSITNNETAGGTATEATAVPSYTTQRNPQNIARLQSLRDQNESVSAAEDQQLATSGETSASSPAAPGLAAAQASAPSAAGAGSTRPNKTKADYSVSSAEASSAAKLQNGAVAGIAAEPVLFLLIPESQLYSRQAELFLHNGEIEREIRVVAITGKLRNKKNRIPNGDFWLGASLAGNFFDPNMGMQGGQALSWVDQQPTGKGGKVYTANASNWDEKERSMPSFDIRLDAAYRLNQRWMLQSSVQYGAYKVNTLTGTFTDPIDQKNYPLYYTNFSYDRLQIASPNSRTASPVNAMNTYRFLSVPITFNYVLLENKIGLAINSGISSEIFLGGHIDGMDDSRLEKYEISAGENSPFRKFHFNALLGAQLFYRAGPNHLLTIEPTYKYSISDFHKNESFFGSRPRQFGVAAGFRFILH